ncbi:MAG TPA: isochorismatase family protein, partial [Chthonomonadales bacterium]|nr:isochorismatase family protein [Chthonomonadales bacterium]
MSRGSPYLLKAESTALVAVDMQDPFLAPIWRREPLIASVRLLVRCASILRVPVISTTQYSEKMGGPTGELRPLLPRLHPPFDKLCFSCFSEPAFAAEIGRTGRKQILLCGVEAHICVAQTALEMLHHGFQVHIAADAVSSRSEENRRIGLERVRQAGCVITCVESAVYEWLERS